MTPALWAVFLASAGVLVYTWLGYPLLLLLLRRLRRAPVKRGTAAPRVAVIIAAYNEQEQIEARIRNLLELDYPAGNLEIIVASDGSDDETPQRARVVGGERIRVLHWPARRGRATVHNDAVAAARGEIVVFTDAATRFEPGFLRNLVAPFADPAVGCVTAELGWRSPQSNRVQEGRRAYWRYEFALRRWESDCAVLCVASGPCMAVRKQLYRALASPAYDVDFITPLDVLQAGFRVVHEPAARAEEALFAGDAGEFRAEVRMVTRNLSGYLHRRFMIASGVSPAIPWALFSHKVLRWLSPFFMLSLVLSSACLAAPLARLALVLQAAFYLTAVGGWLTRAAGRRNLALRMAYGFCLANASFFVGVLRALRGRPLVVYNKC